VSGRSTAALLVGLLVVGCQAEGRSTPARVLEAIEKGCSKKDVGLILMQLDAEYEDDIGGAGRLEDDLRHLFVVYGPLAVKHEDLTLQDNGLTAHLVVSGKGLRYSGPQRLKLTKTAAGPVISSGLFLELRGIIETLRERRIALENGSPERLARLISAEYKGQVGGKAALIKRLRDDLAAVSMQALIVDDLDIEVGGKRAKAIQTFLLITEAGGKKIENKARERIMLQKEGSLWRIIGGLG
jgi:hypothetical protein